MDEVAEKILEILPQDGSKLTGSQIKDALSLSNLDFKKAKAQLVEYALVVVGRGRGGSVARIPGAEAPVEAPKPSQAQKLEYAREAKQSRAKELRIRNEIEAKVLAECANKFPHAKRVVVTMNNKEVFVEVDGKMWGAPKYEYEE